MPKPKSKNKRPITHDQWIEIKRIHGKTVTEYFPSNEVFEAERQQRDPAPTLVYRRLFFVHGVPGEYEWTSPPDEAARQLGGCLVMRLLPEDWLKVYEKERKMHPRHVLPSPSQPMPPELGVCSCEACTKSRENNGE